jgi:uncharacterized OsmC-like protein
MEIHGVDADQLEETIEAVGNNPGLGSFTFRAETEWDEALQCSTTIDAFEQNGETIESPAFTIDGDEPKQILGDRTAPNAVELLLAALGSCLSVGYAANAAAMGIELNDLRFDFEGEIDLRGFLGLSDEVRPGYENITCTAYIDADADEDELEALRERVESTSPVMDNLTNEVPVETDIVAE